MSEFDEMDFDGLEDELAESFENNPEQLKPEDVLKMTMLNHVTNKQTNVEIRDKEGNAINLGELIEQILHHIADQSKENNNAIIDQLIPVAAQMSVCGLGRLVGINFTSFLLMNELTKTSIINMMVVSFLLLKFIQENDLTIYTTQIEVSEEEIAEIERKSQASSVATMGAMMGENPMDILEKLLEEGKITKQDLTDLLGRDKEDDNKK